MYKEARELAGLSQAEAAFRVAIGTRTLSYYESLERMPAPDVVLRMAREYRNPNLTIRYCRECPIGEVYSYEYLDNIDKSIPAVTMKLVNELKEAVEAMDSIIEISVNKRNKQDFTEQEWTQFVQAIHELLDVEHNIEIMKIALEGLTEEVDLVPELVRDHNQKCLDRGYIKKEKAPALAAAR